MPRPLIVLRHQGVDRPAAISVTAMLAGAFMSRLFPVWMTPMTSRMAGDIRAL